jgi:hypothetical protein
MSDFQPENLQNAWDLFAEYVDVKLEILDLLLKKSEEARVTWGLIIQYDALVANTVQSDLQKKMSEILSRASVPFPFDGVCNEDGEKIYLIDLLGYIKARLATPISEESIDGTPISEESIDGIPISEESIDGLLCKLHAFVVLHTHI